MARETKTLLLPADATARQRRQEILRCAAEVRRFGCGQQADRLERVAELMKPPTLRGVVAGLNHPNMWATKDHTLWLAERLVTAGKLVSELLRDAEITGSLDTLERAREWMQSMGFDEADGFDDL